MQNFTVFDQDRNILYRQGVGGTEVTVVNADQDKILDPKGNTLFQRP